MKKLILTILIALLAFSLVSLVACGKDGESSSSSTNSQQPAVSSSDNGASAQPPASSDGGSSSSSQNPADSSSGKPSDSSAEEELKEIEGVSFNNEAYTYTGEKYSIFASNVPQGVTADYEGNGVTDAGEYYVTVKLSGQGFKTKTLKAKLTINKASLAGKITLADNQTAEYDGELHSPVYEGNLPSGVNISWKFNNVSVGGVSEAGTYKVTLTISGKNYEPLTLTAYYKIKRNFKDFAKQFIEKFGSVPEPWSFLPSTFAPQHKTVASVPNFTIDSEPTADTKFVNVSDIPQNVIGKQLDVVYGVLNKTTFALKYVNEVHKVANSIVKAYQEYLDKDPKEYKVFSGTAGVFSYAIEIDENVYYIRGAISGVSIELFADLTKKTYGAKIQPTQSTVVKYTVATNKLTMAVNVQNVAATAVEFVRKNGTVEGYVYEYLNAAGYYETASAAYLNVGEVYTTVIGTKGDFIPGSNGRNCEIYRNSDGVWVGNEVSEQLTENKSYDTLWFHLSKVSGINSVIRQEKQNVLNANTVYINGATDSIHTKMVGTIFTDASRRFDIEFKKIFAYTLNEDGEYERVSFEIPMLFVQESQLSTFNTDFYEKNKAYLTTDGVTLNSSPAENAAVKHGYYDLLPVYQSIADNISIQDICKYLGIACPEKEQQ